MSVAEKLIPAQPAPPLPPQKMSGARLTGYTLLLLWGLLAISLVMMVVNGFDPEKFAKYGPRYLHGLMTTLILVSISMAGGAILSLPLTFARMSSNPFLNGLAYGYVYVFRGTPLLAQLYLIYYGLGNFRHELEAAHLWWFFRDAWYCGLFAMSLNTAAYQTEILRGAIQSVPKGQREGASSLAISKAVTFWKIIMPQAMIVALRPYNNELILLIKGSAVVAIITVFDLMGETRYAFSRTFDYQTYLWAAIFYLAIVQTLSNGVDFIEARLTRHLKR
ncbi:ABC transporter permease [Rhizobium sp. PAMB 3174]